jgi:hypothetical protein
MGAAAIPIALMVGSAIVKARNDRKTAKKQDREVAEGIRRQGEEQRQANARINETLDFFQESEAGDIRDSLSKRYSDQLRLKQAQGLAGFDTAGDSSDAFKGRSAQRQSDVVGRSDVLQGLFSTIDASDDQRLLEGFERGDLGSDLSINSRNSAAENYLTQLRLASIQRSPWLDILSAGMSGAAQGTAGGFGSTIAGSGTIQAPAAINATSAARLPAASTTNIFRQPNNGRRPSRIGLQLGP